MSAEDKVQNYRAWRDQLSRSSFINCAAHDALASLADAAIEALEEELVAYKSDQRDDFEEDKCEMERKYTTQMKRAERAEADLAALKARNLTPDRDVAMAAIARAEQAEAELAALKARRCETCGYWPHYHICKLGYNGADDTYACNRWTARGGR